MLSESPPNRDPHGVRTQAEILKQDVLLAAFHIDDYGVDQAIPFLQGILEVSVNAWGSHDDCPHNPLRCRALQQPGYAGLG